LELNKTTQRKFRTDIYLRADLWFVWRKWNTITYDDES